ncbi:MAG TPA: ParA family protein [Enteractinococcus sp.]
MRTVAFLNGKGGVGKTTSSFMTAEAARRAGYTTAVLDVDPQGSASDWADRAADHGTPLGFDVVDANEGRMESKAKRANVDYLFIDTGPNDPSIIEAAAKLADFVIIPTRTTPGDLDRAFRTYARISGAAALMLWDIDPRRQLYKQAREIIASQEIALLTTEIPSREDVNKLWFTDLQVDSLYGYESVFEELHAVLNALTEGDQL